MPTPEEELAIREKQRQQHIVDAIHESEQMGFQEEEHDTKWAEKTDYYSQTFKGMSGMNTEVQSVTTLRDAGYDTLDASTKKQRKIIEKINKHRDDMSKTKALMAETRQAVMEAKHSRMDSANNADLTRQGMAAEKNIYTMRLKFAEQAKVAAYSAVEADVLTKALPEEKVPEIKARINLRYQEDKIDAIVRYLKLLPLESSERKEMASLKESAEKEYSSLKHELKVILKPEEKKSLWNKAYHFGYDVSKAFMSAWNGANPYSHEGATYTDPQTGKTLINVGRAFMGGTKPMYVFEDPNDVIGVTEDGSLLYQQYLFKEAINCVGVETPERALVTEAASKLQQKLFGSNSVPAFVARDSNDRIVGSFQKRVSPYKGGVHKTGPNGEDLGEIEKVDLFTWQKKPETPLDPDVSKQVLREHILDWLLCNFDTKGENFLQGEDGQLVSIDKEASFSKVEDPDALVMSSSYKGNMNDTIYNIMFQEFEKGRLEDLDFDYLEQFIEKVEKMSDSEYTDAFMPYFQTRWGISPSDSFEDRKRLRDIVDVLVAKRVNIRRNYEEFITTLIQKHLESNPESKMRDKLIGGRFYFKEKLERERREREYYNGHTVVQIAMDETKEKGKAIKINVPLMAPLRPEEMTHDEEMVKKCVAITMDTMDHRDGKWSYIGDEFLDLLKLRDAIVPEDVDGSLRTTHEEQNAGTEELTETQIEMAEGDVMVLYKNSLRDSYLDAIAANAIPAELSDTLDISYVSQNYVKVIEAAFGAKRTYEEDKAKAAELKESARKVSLLSMLLKNSSLVTCDIFEGKARIAAWTSTIEKLQSELASKPESAKYINRMLEKATEMRDLEQKKFDAFVNQDKSFKTPKNEPYSFETFRDDVNVQRVLQKKANLVEISKKLQELDKKDTLTAAEEKRKKGYIKSLIHLVADRQTLETPLECFEFKSRDAKATIRKMREKIASLTAEAATLQGEAKTKVESEIAEITKSRKLLGGYADAMVEHAKQHEAKKGTPDGDTHFKLAMEIEKKIRIEQALFTDGYDNAETFRNSFVFK